ncbi:hypothetical protein HY413_02420 [Candidatus Kaiserbacteria bacterium]|nr:hypothetical protein [Candidatus Kaiserbacteria bacterium]
MNASYGSTFLVGFTAGVLVLFAIGIVTKGDIRYMGAPRADTAILSGEDVDAVTAGKMSGMRATLNVQDQNAGAAVSVDHVAMEQAGWVVVHEIENGHVLNALGAARLDAGAHSDVGVELLRGTEPGGRYAVILYSDNGDKQFEVHADLPVIDTAGNPVMQSFRTFGGAAGQ